MAVSPAAHSRRRKGKRTAASSRCAMLGVMPSSPRAIVELVCSFQDRLAGTDAERRVAKALAGELGGAHRRVAIEPTYVHPQWAAVHALHCALAAVGSMLVALEVVAGFALVLLAAVSAYLDLSARHYLLRRLLFRRASQNVFSRSQVRERPHRVVLCANVDAPRTGAAYNPLPIKVLHAAAQHFPVISSPTRIWFWSIVLLLPPLGAQVAGLDPGWIPLLQLPQTLILIAASFLLGEIALSPASPGANANASGVAALTEVVRRLDAEPPAELAVDALLCGGGETTMEGMRAFLRAHRRELDRDRTWFISLASVGRGDPRYALSQGLAVSLPLEGELIALCQAIEIADGGERLRPAAVRDGAISAALVARAHGYPAIAVTSREGKEPMPLLHHTPEDTPERVDPQAIDRAASFTVELVRLLDRDLARRSRSARRAPAATAA